MSTAASRQHPVHSCDRMVKLLLSVLFFGSAQYGAKEKCGGVRASCLPEECPYIQEFIIGIPGETSCSGIKKEIVLLVMYRVETLLRANP